MQISNLKIKEIEFKVSLGRQNASEGVNKITSMNESFLSNRLGIVLC